MEKQKFTWEEFKKGWGLNGMVISDTKENMAKFCILAEENGIILENESMKYNLGSNIKCLYFSNVDKNLKCSTIIDHRDIQYYLQEILSDINSPKIETGDVVELRNGTICVMLSNAFLNLNDKIVESELEDYTEDYLYNDYGYEEFDVMKIKHIVNPFDYFRLDNIEIEWDWVREEREEEKEIRLEVLDPGTKVKYIYKDATVYLDRKYERKNELYKGLNIEQRLLRQIEKSGSFILSEKENGKAEMLIRVEGCEQNYSHTQSVETEPSNKEEYNVSKSSRPLTDNAEGEKVRRTC